MATDVIADVGRDAGGWAGGEGEGAAGSAARPEAFIWRGRLYVVRDVLATWRERRAWWREALDADDARVRPGETLAAAARERQVWRVEASPGWSFTPGVYDLAHDESASEASQTSGSQMSGSSGSPGPSRGSQASEVRSRARDGGRPDGRRSEGGWFLIRVAD